MSKIRKMSVLAALAVTGVLSASTVFAEPVKVGAGGQHVGSEQAAADPFYLAPDRVLTAAEGIELKRRIAALRMAPQWRWMGNYGNPYDAARVANTPPVAGAGAIMFEVIDNGLIPAWMYY